MHSTWQRVWVYNTNSPANLMTTLLSLHFAVASSPLVSGDKQPSPDNLHSWIASSVAAIKHSHSDAVVKSTISKTSWSCKNKKWTIKINSNSLQIQANILEPVNCIWHSLHLRKTHKVKFHKKHHRYKPVYSLSVKRTTIQFLQINLW